MRANRESGVASGLWAIDSETPLLSHGRWHSGKPFVSPPCQKIPILKTSRLYGFSWFS